MPRGHRFDFALRRGAQISRVVSFLMLAAYASKPEEWADRIEYVDA
jgi:hypothetical protein